jgi:prenylcysteine oxidase/farnesylcysteine lyase
MCSPTASGTKPLGRVVLVTRPAHCALPRRGMTRATTLVLVPLLLAYYHQVASQLPPPPPPQRIAIVGGGIGGAAAAFYIQQFLKNASRPPAHITVFERNDYAGGRLKHISFGPSRTHVELGGAAWVDSNRYMMELTRELRINHTTLHHHHSSAMARLGLLPTLPNISAEVGVWTGDRFAGVPGLLLRRALSELRLAQSELGFLAAIEENYEQQTSHPPFRSIAEFLSWGNLAQYTSVSIEDFFRRRGVKQDLIDFGMVALNRAIYNRDAGANAFALLASLTAELSHHQVVGGNSVLVEALLAAAGATVHLSTTVDTIHIHIHDADEGDSLPPGRRSFTVRCNGSSSSSEFEQVVIAAPLERSGVEIIPPARGPPLPPSTSLDRGFTGWFVTVVLASRLNVAQFDGAEVKLDPSDCTVLTSAHGTTADVPYVCVQPLGKHGSGVSKGVFMVYSDTAIDQRLAELFVGPEAHHVQHWPYTFGQLPPISIGPNASAQVQPVVLAPGLYNANAMESIASAMEISVIGARNAAAHVVARRVGGSIGQEEH